MWMLKDGIGSKKSLNGTWIYLHKAVKLENKLTFKASEILFEATLSNV